MLFFMKVMVMTLMMMLVTMMISHLESRVVWRHMIVFNGLHYCLSAGGWLLSKVVSFLVFEFFWICILLLPNWVSFLYTSCILRVHHFALSYKIELLIKKNKVLQYSAIFLIVRMCHPSRLQDACLGFSRCTQQSFFFYCL
jgi:hypothetical protein